MLSLDENCARASRDNLFPWLRAFTQAKTTTFSGASSRSKNSCSLADVPLLAVADASGYGKSSLVHAGLLNELARRHAVRDGGIEWRAVVMRPGTRPIATLAEQLVAVLTREEIEGEMRAATLEGPRPKNYASKWRFGSTVIGLR